MVNACIFVTGKSTLLMLFISVMFCSEKCADESKILHCFEGKIQSQHKGEYMYFLRIFNKAFRACNNSVEELKLLMETNAGKFSVFDFDLSDPTDPSYEKNRLLAFKCLMPDLAQRRGMNMLWDLFSTNYKYTFIEAWKIGDHYEFVQELIKEFFLIFSLNSHGMSWYSAPTGFMGLYAGDRPMRNSFAAGLFPFMSLFSHSCAPNCDTMNVNGDKLMLYVTQPIKAGEQIFISYG